MARICTPPVEKNNAAHSSLVGMTRLACYQLESYTDKQDQAPEAFLSQEAGQYLETAAEQRHDSSLSQPAHAPTLLYTLRDLG